MMLWEILLHAQQWASPTRRGVIGTDFAHPTFFIIYFSRIRIEADIDRFRIRMWIYRTADSNQKWADPYWK
jgi:hypothetical protein